MSDEKMDYINDDVRDESQYYSTYKTFENVMNIHGIGNSFILEFLEFIREQPQLAVPMLLWIDTFHDFTQLRGVKSQEEEYKYDIASINNVLDFYLKQKSKFPKLIKQIEYLEQDKVPIKYFDWITKQINVDSPEPIEDIVPLIKSFEKKSRET